MSQRQVLQIRANRRCTVRIVTPDGNDTTTVYNPNQFDRPGAELCKKLVWDIWLQNVRDDITTVDPHKKE